MKLKQYSSPSSSSNILNNFFNQNALINRIYNLIEEQCWKLSRLERISYLSNISNNLLYTYNGKHTATHNVHLSKVSVDFETKVTRKFFILFVVYLND